MSYADYSYYRDTYHGGLPEEAFNRLSRRASAYLRQVTFGRIREATEAVRDALCAVVEEMHRQEQGGEITSASNDGYSESYAASGRSAPQRLYDAASLYLADTGLMYRGCLRC